LILVL
ncbi:MAG: hypothetical protein EZS28_055685, partial [Streblomastix strix]